MDMYDTIEKLHKSTIQHGLHNNRIYLLKLHDGDAPDIVHVMDELAQEKKYGTFARIFPMIVEFSDSLFMSCNPKKSNFYY